MIVLKCKERLTADLAKRIAHEWDNCAEYGKVVVLGPEFDIFEFNDRDLTLYIDQLGDA